MKTVRIEYQRADYAGGRLSTRGTIHENRTCGVQKSRLCKGRLSTKGD